MTLSDGDADCDKRILLCVPSTVSDKQQDVYDTVGCNFLVHLDRILAFNSIFMFYEP